MGWVRVYKWNTKKTKNNFFYDGPYIGGLYLVGGSTCDLVAPLVYAWWTEGGRDVSKQN